jgi:ubiquinone/menaquinone biosynthesis C-methylase UbiE
MALQQPKEPKQTKNNDTSWNRVAGWYERLLEGEGTYQKDLILPNLLRLMDLQRGEAVLDLACGPGFFAREFAARGAQVTGADASQVLIEMARAEKIPGAQFFVARADKLAFIKDATMDKVAIVLAMQNIENVGNVVRECARVLKPGGQLFLVLNHPAFRIPQSSSWGWDEKTKMQYRRIDKYLSESKTQIQMHPGAKPGEHTISFHRPLQYYFKALNKAGFAVAALEEWNSNHASEPGPRAKAENEARKEIPLFLCLGAVQLKP